MGGREGVGVFRCGMRGAKIPLPISRVGEGVFLRACAEKNTENRQARGKGSSGLAATAGGQTGESQQAQRGGRGLGNGKCYAADSYCG